MLRFYSFGSDSADNKVQVCSDKKISKTFPEEYIFSGFTNLMIHILGITINYRFKQSKLSEKMMILFV